MEEEERTRYSQLHARVQAGLADLGLSQVCVTSTPVRRTLKLLTALAHGAWVVGEEYLQACARSRSTLDPTPFELVSHIPGCRAARLAGCGSARQRSRQALPRSEVPLRPAAGSRGTLACLGRMALWPRERPRCCRRGGAGALGEDRFATVEPPLLTIQALKGYEVTVRGETSVPRASWPTYSSPPEPPCASAATRASPLSRSTVCATASGSPHARSRQRPARAGARPGTARGRRPPDDGAPGPVPPAGSHGSTRPAQGARLNRPTSPRGGGTTTPLATPQGLTPTKPPPSPHPQAPLSRRLTRRGCSIASCA